MGDSYHSIELSEYQAFYKLLTEVTSDPEWDIGVDLTKLCQPAVQVRQPIISGQPDSKYLSALRRRAVRVLILVFLEVFNEFGCGYRPTEIIALPDMTT